MIEGIEISGIQERYAKYLEEDELYKLKDSREATGIELKLPEAVIQKKYDEYFRAGQFTYLNILRDASGIELKLSEVVVQKKYAEHLQKYGLTQHNIHNLKALIEATGIKPSEEVAQEEYSRFLQTTNSYMGFPSDFKRDFEALRELTGIKPSEEVVQKGYIRFLQEGWSEGFELLRELTGIKPSEAIVKNKIEEGGVRESIEEKTYNGDHLEQTKGKVQEEYIAALMSYMNCWRKHPKSEEYPEGRPGPSQCISTIPQEDGIHYRCLVAFASQSTDGFARLPYQIFHAELLRQGNCPRPLSRSITRRIPIISWLLTRPDVCPLADGGKYVLKKGGNFERVSD